MRRSSSDSGASRDSVPADQLLYPQTGAGMGHGGWDLRALAQLLWDGKWIVMIVTLTVLASVAAYTFSQTPVYEASSTVVLTKSQSVVPGVSTTGRQILSYLSSNLSGADPLQNEVFSINRSHEIRTRVARRLDSLGTNPHTGAPPRLLFDADGNRRSVAAVSAALQGVVQAQPTGGSEGASNAIQLSVSSTSPEEAALLANQYAKAYREWRRRRNRKATRNSRQFLEQQAQDLRTKVREAERNLESFMREEEGVRLDQRTSRAVQRIAELESRREELQITLNMKEARLKKREQELARIRPRLAERLSSGVGSALSRVQQEKAELQADINRITAQNPGLKPTDSGPRAQSLRKLRTRASHLEQEADSLARAYVDRTLAMKGIGSIAAQPRSAQQRGLNYIVDKQEQIAQLRIEVSGLEAKLRTLDAQIAKNRGRLDTLPTKQLQLAQIQRDRRAAEEIYGFVRKKLQEMRIAEESEGAYVEMLNPASVPVQPRSPDTTRNLQLALMLGLVLGIGIVFLRERLDTRIRTPDDLRSDDTHLLGVVPSMAPLVDQEFNGADTVSIDGRTLNTSVAMLTAPSSAAAEAYRQLHVNLRYARPDTSLRALAITSAEKGEGKTTTAVNLAIAAARSGQKVVLVDADLRNPRLHKYLDLPGTPGLTNTLYDEAVLTPTDIDNLVFLPAGEEVPNPSELLGSGRMRHLITVLTDEADLAIIDTPPALPFSDPSALLPHTDGALLVAAAHMTDQRAFDRAYTRLNDVHPGVVGAVLNRFDPESRTYNYYYDDYDYSYQSPQENGTLSSLIRG